MHKRMSIQQLFAEALAGRIQLHNYTNRAVRIFCTHLPRTKTQTYIQTYLACAFNFRTSVF